MLRQAIEGLSEEEFRYKPAPDKWSIHQILIHALILRFRPHLGKKSSGGG